MTPYRMFADVVIVGGGLTGMSVARALVRRGVRDVLVCEREAIGPPAAPTGGFAHCQHDPPALAALAAHGLAILGEPAGHPRGDSGFRVRGLLAGACARDAGALHAAGDARRAAGVVVRTLDAAGAAALWPGGRVPGFAAFSHEPGAGHGDTTRVTRAFAHTARRAGARVLPHTPVAAPLLARGRVAGVLLADGAEVFAGTVVIAAGPSTPALLTPAGVSVPVRAVREWTVVVDPGGAPPRGMPMLSDPATACLVRGCGPRLLVGLGAPVPGPGGRRAGGPAMGAPRPASAERAALAFVRGVLDLPGAEVVSSRVEHHAGTPDGRPAAGPAGPDGLFVAVGAGPLGLAPAPAVGALVADLLCDGASASPRVRAADFTPLRFGSGIGPATTGRRPRPVAARPL